MPCPICGHSSIEELDFDTIDPDFHIERYQCNMCGTIYRWESKRIIEQAEEELEIDDFVDQTAQIRLKQQKQEEWFEEEEE